MGYFTDSSWKHTRATHPFEVLDGSPRGRLMKYDPSAPPDKRVSPLLCGLHFPNGVQLINNKLLLVAESARFRILVIDLEKIYDERSEALEQCNVEERPLPSSVKLATSGMPGFPDNIRKTTAYGARTSSERTLFTVGMGTKNLQPFSLLHFLYQQWILRVLLLPLIPPSLFHSLVPHYGMMGIFSFIESDSSLVLERLLQDPSEGTPFISEGHFDFTNGDLYLGSFRNRFLAKKTNISDIW